MARQREEIDLIVRAIGEGFEKVNKQQKKLADTEKKSAALFKKAKIAALGAAAAIIGTAVALKKVFDVAKGGAAIAQTAESFDLLIEKVGGNVDLLEQLRIASADTISDQQLMSSTATLLAGSQGEVATALANAMPRLLEYAKASNKLNPALGDTTFLLDSIATGVKRASPLILDNLGLTIKIGEANERYAASLGKTVAQLSAEDKQMALLNDVMRAGDVLIDQVGGSTDSAGDSFARLETIIANVTDNMKVMVAEGITPVVTDLQEMLIALQDIDIEGENFLKMLGDAIKNTPALGAAISALEQAWNQAADAAREHNATVPPTVQGLSDEKAAIAALRTEAGGLADSIEEAAKANLGLITSLGEVTEAELAQAGVEALNQAFSDGKIDEQQYREGLGKLGRDILGIPQSTIDAQVAFAGLNQQFQSGKIDAMAYVKALDRLDDAIKNLASAGGGTLFVTPPRPSAPPVIQTPGGAIGGQHGLDMVVPSGFSGDRFPIQASSGERVRIETPAQQRAGGGASVQIGEINISTEVEGEEFLDQFRRMIEA